jgi:hypothetical protein
MENNITWVAVLGAITGVLGTLGWLIHYIVGFVTKPRLFFSEGPYVKEWYFLGTPERRKFVNFEVGVKNERTAKRCVATIEIIEQPKTVTHLGKRYPLHWADVPFSGLSTSMEPVDIGGESHRLDVVFTKLGMDGANIALTIALGAPNQAPQAILPPGEYVMRVSVFCDNGRGISRTIRISSPTNWEGLKAEQI